MSEAARRPRILHIGGGSRLIDAFADADHAFVSTSPIEPRRKVFRPSFPPLSGKPLPSRLKQLAAAMAGYDLVCTHGWDAIDAAMAHTLFADVYKLAPLIHHEDEVHGEKRSRTFFRRIALGRSAALIVSSHTLERMALEVWQQPRSRVRFIPNGIDLRPFNKAPKRDALPGLIKRRDELWAGTLADTQDLPALIRVFGTLPESWQLVVMGEGSDREAVLATAEAHGLEDRVHPMAMGDLAMVAGLFDIFASDRAVVEAMAAGLPVVASRAGDAGTTLSSENGPYLVAPGDQRGLADAFEKLASDPGLRKRIGEANRARARAEYDEAVMIDRYRALYWSAMGRR